MTYKCEDGREVPFEDNIQGRVPECLQDDATFLIQERGYSQAEIVKLGIRAGAAIEGYMSRGDSAALLRLLAPALFGGQTDQAAVQVAMRAIKTGP